MGNGDTPMSNLPVALLAAVLAGGTGSAGWSMLSDPRPDPWTGTDAREAHRMMEQSWHEDLETMNKRLERIEIRMDLRFDRLQDLIREHDKP